MIMRRKLKNLDRAGGFLVGGNKNCGLAASDGGRCVVGGGLPGQSGGDPVRHYFFSEKFF